MQISHDIGTPEDRLDRFYRRKRRIGFKLRKKKKLVCWIINLVVCLFVCLFVVCINYFNIWIRVKMEVGYGILMEGRGIKTPRWERDLLILAGRMRDGFNFDSRIQDEKTRNLPFVTRRTRL